MQPLLEVRNLHTQFLTPAGPAHALNGVDLTIQPGESVGLVGESGSGKTVTALSLLRLLPETNVSITADRMTFQGIDLLSASERQMCALRGGQIGMIFQEPGASLNPVYRVGEQIGETIETHQPKLTRRAVVKRTRQMMMQVGLPGVDELIHYFPHELSGGMKQRVMIAVALSCRPSLLIADEPTTALDVTIQAQILDLLGRLRRETGLSLVMVTHDMGVIAETVERVVVIYAGRIVEQAPVRELFANPRHPYTLGLRNSIPSLHTTTSRLPELPGNLPNPTNLPQGCTFADRCRFAQQKCRTVEPPLINLSNGRFSRCWYHHKLAKGGANN